MHFQVAHHAPARIDFDFLCAALAAQYSLHSGFDAAFPDPHAGHPHQGIVIDADAFDTANVAHDVTDSGALAVFAFPGHFGAHAGKVGRQKADLCNVFERQVTGDRNRCIAALFLGAFGNRLKIFRA